jgi:hypothetical protein
VPEPQTQDKPDLARIGDWGGTAGAPIVEESYVLVGYFGTDIRVVTDPLHLEQTMEEFLDLAATMDDEDVRAIGTVRAFLRALVHPDDFAKFWRLVKSNRQDIDAQMGFGKWLVEQMTGHPFAEASVSSPAAASTEPKSAEDVSLRVQRRYEEQGRPDLAIAVLDRRESLALQQATG